jgi:hypothetical protein
MTTVIYVIYCTFDETLPIYIGKTKDLKRRWRDHKYDCMNENGERYNYPVYKFIRNNHGVENWTIDTLYTLDEEEDGSEAEEYFINAVGMDGLLNDIHGVNYSTETCEHGKIRRQCVECNGSSICIHGKRREICKECNGSSICIHGKQRQYCVECNGSSTCPHKKANKKNCVECYPWYCFACKTIISVGSRKRHFTRKKHKRNLLLLLD